MGYISKDEVKEFHLEVVMGPEPKKDSVPETKSGEVDFTQLIQTVAKTMRGTLNE